MPAAAESFGSLLKFLRKRAHLTQRDLAQAVGYTEAHICRLEKDERLPDVTTVAALFIPALDLKSDPAHMERLLTLAARARDERHPARIKISQITIEHHTEQELGAVEDVPAPGAQEMARPNWEARVRAVLAEERAVVLCGMAGLGKTALAAAVARAHSAGPVFWLTLAAGVTASAEAILRQLALFFLAQGDSRVRPVVEVRSPAMPLPLDQQLTLLRAALAQQPALVCLDDAHLLLGNATALATLRQLCATTAAAVLLISREALPLPVTHLPLTGLDDREAIQLAVRLGLNPHAPFAHALLEKAGGNPMLLRLAVGTASADWSAESPSLAAYILQTALGDLSSEGQYLATLVSIFRQPVDLLDETLLTLSAEAGQPFGPAAPQELQRRFLIADPRRAELHPMVSEHVRLQLAAQPQRRKRLHRLAAEWAARADQVLEAAYHFTRAEQIRLVVDTLAGREETLFRRGQALAAAEVLGEALRVARGKKTISADLLRWLHQMRGDLLTNSLQTAQAETEFREALALATHPAVRADLVYRMTQVLVTRNEYAEALELARSALQTLTPADVWLTARLNLMLAAAHYNLGQFEEARCAAEEALALTRQFSAAPWQMLEDLRARAHYWVANTARIRREPDLALTHIQLALAAARRSGHRRLENTVVGFLGGLLYDRGDLEASLRYRAESVEQALALGDSYWAAYSLIHLSSNHLVRNEPEVALAQLDRARDVLEPLGDAHGLADQASLRASALLQLGEVDAARAVMQELLSDARAPDRPRMYGYHLCKLAMCQMAGSPPDAAAAQTNLRAGLDLSVTARDPMLRFDLHSTLAMAQLAAGEPQAARALLEATPPHAGLSLWARLERTLVEGYVALGNGDVEAARCAAAAALEQAAPYPLFCLRAERLALAIQDPQPALFPRCLWVVCPR